MVFGKETLPPANKEMARLNLAVNLLKIEEPLFTGGDLSDAAFLTHLQEIRAEIDLQGAHWPEKAIAYLERLEQHVSELIAYKQSLLETGDAKRSFLEELGIVFGENTVQVNDFSLDLRDPLCIVLTYYGQNELFMNSFGERKNTIYPNQRGRQFPDLPLFSTNNLARNKVIMLLSEFMKNRGFNYSDRRGFHERVQKHEQQHVLDTIYRADEPILNDYDLLVRKTLLELAATAAEDRAEANYIMAHLKIQDLFDYADDPEQLAIDWHDQLVAVTEILNQLKRKPGYSLRQNVVMVMVSQSLDEVVSIYKLALNSTALPISTESE